jgi:type I restriction enzyme S subunit
MRRPITARERTSGPYPYYGANGQQDSVADYLFDEPLVLLAEDGGYFDDPARGVAYGVTGKCWVNNHAHVLRPKPDFDFGFIKWHLTYYDVSEFVNGTTRAKLTKGAAERIPLIKPPLPEQRRIADILDKAHAVCQKRKEVILLTQELLRSAFLEMFGDPVTNPKAWEVKPLGDLVEIRGGGTPSRARADFFDGSIPWATAKDFKSDFMSDTEEHITDEAVRASATQVVPAGTLLVVVKSKILMRRLPIAVTRVPLCFNQDVKGLVPCDLNEGAYLAAHIRLAQRQLLGLARGVNTEGLTLPHLRSHSVMQPPTRLRSAFTAFETRTREALEREELALGHAESLFDSLVADVFTYRSINGKTSC